MRIAAILTLLVFTVLGFQNCGGSISEDPGFFIQNQNDPNSSDASGFGLNSCYEDGGCAADPYMLWLKIRESNPYYVTPSNTHFTVAGSCGVGNFSKHTVQYTLQESDGAQKIVGKTENADGDGRCELGLFTIPIKFLPSLNGYNPAGKRFELTVEIFGLGDGFQPIPNPGGVSRSRIEVIFEN